MARNAEITSHPADDILRRAEAADRPVVEAVVEAAYAGYIPRMGRKPGPMLDDYASQIAQGRVHVLERAGVVLGLVVLIDEADALLLDNVAVAPAAHGRGIGRTLLEFAEAAARARGFAAIKLYTHETMVENIALYGRIGYVETHRGEANGLRRVYMRKSLAPKSLAPIDP